MELSEILCSALRARLEQEGSRLKQEGCNLEIIACCPHIAGVSLIFQVPGVGTLGHVQVGYPIGGRTDEGSLKRWVDAALPKLCAEAEKLEKSKPKPKPKPKPKKHP